MEKIYTIGNIDCANCAAKIEAAMNKLPEIEEAVITFATKRLKVVAENPDELVKKLEDVANSIESGITITERNKVAATGRRRHREHEHHHHEDACGCGCDHDHEHEHEHHHHHDHHEHKHHHHEINMEGMTEKVYSIENIDCANCASKIETLINRMPEVEDAVLTFTTRKLKVIAKDPDALVSKMEQLANTVEHGVVIVGRDEAERIEKAEIAARANESWIKRNRDLVLIVAGACLFAAGLVMEHVFDSPYTLYVLVAAYVLLGSQIVYAAVRNLFKGNLFDENFLMSIATLGAFAIHEYPEAVGVMLFYRIGEFFEHKAVERSRGQIMEAVDLRPDTVNLLEDGEVQVIGAEEAELGDILVVRPGDRVPLDCVVVEGNSQVDTSAITGEPVPVRVQPGSEVFSGCVNTNGLLKVRVTKLLQDSMVTRILDSVENAAASKPTIDRFITRFAKVYTPFVVLAALAVAIIPSLLTGNHHYWIYTALTFLVISCPCALVLSVPLAFFSGIGAGSKRGILFKGGISLEVLSKIKAVVMDKTGTITKGQFRVQRFVLSGNLPSIMGATEGAGKEDMEGFILALAAGCEKNSTHPIGESIVAAATERGLTAEDSISMEEISGKGITAQRREGTVLCGSRQLLADRGVDIEKLPENHGGTEVLVAVNGQFAGAIIISDGIKDEAKEAIGKLKKQGIFTAMLTGDGENAAEYVAKETGIDKVFAKLLPSDKLDRLKEIRAQKGGVMFVGDGINDAPVLAGADVGAAMGSGADAAIEAADVVFMTSQVDAIPQSIHLARKTARIAVENVVFALIIKALVMVLGVAGLASMWMAVFADTGVAMLCVLNSIRVLYSRDFR